MEAMREWIMVTALLSLILISVVLLISGIYLIISSISKSKE